MISAWAPTDVERARIAVGAPLFLHIQGYTHPVVAMAVGDVPEHGLSVATVLNKVGA